MKREEEWRDVVKREEEEEERRQYEVDDRKLKFL